MAAAAAPVGGGAQVRAFLHELNYAMTDSEFQKLMDGIDVDHNGEIDYNEFLASFGEAISGASDQRAGAAFDPHMNLSAHAQHMRQSHIAAGVVAHTVFTAENVREKLRGRIVHHAGTAIVPMFRQYDDDGSGEVTAGEFHEILNQLTYYMESQEFAKLFQAIDVNRSGHISYAALKTYVKKP